VPYQSLRYSKTWDSTDCNSQVVEVQRAEHREILADKRARPTSLLPPPQCLRRGALGRSRSELS
jgi:hypothetical protein